MSLLSELIAHGVPKAGHRPWPRVSVNSATWEEAIEALASGTLTLVALFGDGNLVHMALADGGEFALLSLACPDRHFPSVGRRHPPAIRLERGL